MINLSAVRADLRAALSTIANLNVYDWQADHIEPPAAIVLLPDRVIYQTAYRGSAMTFEDVQIVIAIRRGDAKVGTEVFDPYVARSGAASVYAALENYGAYGALTDVTVTHADFGSPVIAGVEYMAVMFHCNVTG